MKEGKHCEIEGCKRAYRAKGFCNVHFRKWRRGELDRKPRYKACVEEKCSQPQVRMGLCAKHYAEWTASKKGTTTATASPEISQSSASSEASAS